MRLSCLIISSLLCTAQLLVAGPGEAQPLKETKVSVGLNNESLKHAFEQIEAQTPFRFAYVESQVRPYGSVNLPKRTRTLYSTLELLLGETELEYSVKQNTIVVVAKISEAQPDDVFQYSWQQMFPPDKAITVTGHVTDGGGIPLPDVSVTRKGSESGVTTGTDGSYSIRVPEDAILVFSSVGYKTLEEPVNNRTTVNVTLQSDVRDLNEVVVIGYGQVKQRDLTGSVSQIKADDVNAYPATNVIQSLQGRAAGVQVLQNNGSPGGAISVRIRGASSILGSNEPLYVVDGFPVSGNPTFLQNADVESIEILKDASSTAIYGSRGANGVVLITTKSGHKGGKTYVDYEAGYSIQMPAKKIDLMNAQQYALFYNEQIVNDGGTAYFTDEQIADFGKSPGTNWQDLVMHNAPIFSTNLTVSGGNEKTQFSFSSGAFLQDGIIRNSDFDRYSLRSNVSHKISDMFSLSSNLSMTRINSQRQNSGRGNRGNDLISGMLTAPPTLDPYNPDGSFRRLNTAYPFISNALNNPLTTIYNASDRIEAERILANVAFTIKPFNGFSLRISGGVENFADRTDYYYKIDTTTNSYGSAGVGSSNSMSLLNENVATYTKDFGVHSITATAGFTYQDKVYKAMGASGIGFLSDVTESYNIQGGETQGIANSSYYKWVLLSYLGRVNYTLMDKYLFTVSFRRDGSSRYSEGNKWGSFPSAAFAWRVSDEAFMQKVNFLSDLKLRVSYGSTGNTSIDPYQTLNQLLIQKTVMADGLVNAAAPGTTLPGDLRWEIADQFDVGLDASILDRRLHITLDYYNKQTRDLLNTVQLPASMGYTQTLRNVGKMQNAGFEIGLNGLILDGPVKWDATLNVSRSRNKVVKLYGGQDILGSSFYTGAINDNINLLREGQPMGVFYGYKETGYSDEGILEFEDRSKDGAITADDKTYIGNPNPDFIYGFNSVVSWKGFEFTLFVQGSQGNDIFNLNKTTTLDLGMGLNLPVAVYNDHWTPDNTDAAYPKLTRTQPGNMSDRFVEDGSYLRFKNIQLAYNLGNSWLKAPWLRSMQVYVSAQNMITLTGYSWFDPEINAFGGTNSINQGIDYFSYPTAKSVTFGIRCGF